MRTLLACTLLLCCSISYGQTSTIIDVPLPGQQIQVQLPGQQVQFLLPGQQVHLRIPDILPTPQVQIPCCQVQQVQVAPRCGLLTRIRNRGPRPRLLVRALQRKRSVSTQVEVTVSQEGSI